MPHGSTDVSILDGDFLADYLQRNPSISVVSSHHFRYPKPVIPGVVLFDCCFLRHPLERLQSMYGYFRKMDSPDPLCQMARRETAAGFLKNLIDFSPNQVCNVQVNLLANAGVFTRPADETDLQRAAGFLREMAIPGVVEQYDESLVTAEYFLKPAFPELRLEYVPQNVSRPLGGSIEERQEQLRGNWGSDLYETLTKLNRFDLELFRRAGDEIRRRFALVPEGERRMEEFRDRCAQHLAAC